MSEAKLRAKRNKFRYAVALRGLIHVTPRRDPCGTLVRDDGSIEIREDLLKTVLADDNALDMLIEESESKGMTW